MTFVSALLLGLFASVHCAGMCGGLQMAFSHGYHNGQVIRTAKQTSLHLLLLNTGRVLTYILLGLCLSFFGSKLIAQLNLPYVSNLLRMLVAALLIMIGVQLLLTERNLFAWLEKIGYQIWSKLQPKVNSSSTKTINSLRLGLLWGCLPCGLVYSVLIAAALSGSALSGSLVMLGFGLGTLPAMLLTGGALQSFRAYLKRGSLRTAGSFLFICAGCLMMAAPYLFTHSLMQQYPVLFNMVFCFSL